MFKRLIQSLTGKSAAKADAPAARPGADPGSPAPPATITAYDVHGREIQVSRQEWRDRMLLPQLQAHWSEPDALYGLIANALADGFLAEVEPASRQLLAIDPGVERSHVVRAIVLKELGKLDEAERVLGEAVAKVGETGVLLSNLAKLQSRRGDEYLASATLWKAITLDPNQDNGLAWWLARKREQGGEEAYVAALEKASSLHGSWRPQLWLGCHKLTAGNTEAALDLFREVLATGAYDAGALTTISGDLGNAGQIEEMIELVAPLYDPAEHAPQTGMNLLLAYLHLDRLDEGERLLERLYARDLPPFRPHLDGIAQRYQERRGATAQPRPLVQEDLQIGQLPFDRPIWMYGLRDPDWLFEAKPADAQRVMFLTLGKVMDSSGNPEEQREDELGRLSRAIPLYLAESAYEWTGANAQTLVAVVMGGGPVLFGVQDEAGEREAAQRLAELADVVVQGSIEQTGERWTVSLTLRRTADGESIGQETISAGREGLEAAVQDLESRLLARFGGAASRPHDACYSRPNAEQMPVHLNALAQSLVLSLVANEVMPRDALWGERNMLEWPLRMTLHWPQFEVAKLLYFAGLSNAARYKSALLPEFEKRTFALLGEMRAAASPRADLEPLLQQAFGRTDALAAVRAQTVDPSRLAWIDRVSG